MATAKRTGAGRFRANQEFVRRDARIGKDFWRPRCPGFPYRPVALRPCLSTGLPLSVQCVYSTPPPAGKRNYPRIRIARGLDLITDYVSFIVTAKPPENRDGIVGSIVRADYRQTRQDRNTLCKKPDRRQSWARRARTRLVGPAAQTVRSGNSVVTSGFISCGNCTVSRC